MGNGTDMARRRRHKAVTEALEDLLGRAAASGLEGEDAEELRGAVARFLVRYADARSDLEGAPRAVAPAGVSAPVLADGSLALPGMRIAFRDGSKACVRQTVLGRSGASCMVVLDDGRTLGAAAVSKAMPLRFG